jgi:hypothetical protein
MGEGYAAIHGGGGLPVGGGVVGSLMTHSAGSVFCNHSKYSTHIGDGF